MNRWRSVLALMLGVGCLVGAELEVLPAHLNPRNHYLHVVANQDPDLPGRGRPAREIGEAVYEVVWGDADKSRSFLVVEGGGPGFQPAMVYTMWHQRLEGGFPVLRVFYLGRAFGDATGRLQLDCRLQPVSGPDHDGWSPDSFAINDRKVSVIDDRGHTSTGQVTAIYRRGEPAGEDELDYRQIRRIISCYVTGIL